MSNLSFQNLICDCSVNLKDNLEKRWDRTAFRDRMNKLQEKMKQLGENMRSKLKNIAAKTANISRHINLGNYGGPSQV